MRENTQKYMSCNTLLFIIYRCSSIHRGAVSQLKYVCPVSRLWSKYKFYQTFSHRGFSLSYKPSLLLFSFMLSWTKWCPRCPALDDKPESPAGCIIVCTHASQFIDPLCSPSSCKRECLSEKQSELEGGRWSWSPMAFCFEQVLRVELPS